MDSAKRIWAICRITVKETVRMKLFWSLALIGLLVLASSRLFREFDLGGAELRFLADFGQGGISLLGPLVAIVVSVQLLYGEFERRTVVPLLVRPVAKVEFLLGKWLGAVLCIAAFECVMLLCLAVSLWIRENQLLELYPDLFATGRMVSYSSIWLYGLGQLFRLGLIAAAATFFCSYATSSLFAFFSAFLYFGVGQLRGSLWQQADSGGGMLQSLLESATLAVPNFALFEGGGVVLSSQAGSGTSGMLFAFVYAVAYGLVFMILANLALSRREF